MLQIQSRLHMRTQTERREVGWIFIYFVNQIVGLLLLNINIYMNAVLYHYGLLVLKYKWAIQIWKLQIVMKLYEWVVVWIANTTKTSIYKSTLKSAYVVCRSLPHTALELQELNNKTDFNTLVQEKEEVWFRNRVIVLISHDH